MPYAAPRHCPYHRRLFSGARCPDCAKEAKQRADANRPSASGRGYNVEWRKARAEFIEAHPTCCKCGSPTTIVDHVTPHKGDQTLFWSRSNWQPLCKPCHDEKTAKHDGAFGRPTRGGGSEVQRGARDRHGGLAPERTELSNHIKEALYEGSKAEARSHSRRPVPAPAGACMAPERG